ncbi:MAG TPA: YraN family protein [Terriglobia bacterium]|nr:YraN family protein [Terriglobia bacterium]
MPFPLLFHRLLTFGRRSEILAIDHIRTLGYRIVIAPYRTKSGEVDVIAWDGGTLVFIEVKARQNSEPPEDSVGYRKQQRIIRAAQAYISRYRLHETPYRFDILAVTAIPHSKPQFRHLRDAFNVDDFSHY